MGHRGRISLTQLTLLFVGLMGITAVLALVEGNLTLAAIVMALTIAAIGASAVVQYYGYQADW